MAVREFAKMKKGRYIYKEMIDDERAGFLADPAFRFLASNHETKRP